MSIIFIRQGPAPGGAGISLFLAAAVLALVYAAPGAPLRAQTRPFVSVTSRHDFAATLQKLAAAARDNRIGVVTRASAQRGAASIGVKIPGNQVWGLFAPRFAVRMLRASVAAGFEAPVRLYIIEAPGGMVTVRYRKPSVVFAPYRNKELDAMARELDTIFRRVTDAVR